MNNRQREKTAGCCCSSFYSIVPHFNFFIFISHLSSLNSSLLRTTREQQREERGSLFSSLICTAPFSASPALRTLPVFLFFFRQAFAFGVVAHTHSLIANVSFVVANWCCFSQELGINNLACFGLRCLHKYLSGI